MLKLTDKYLRKEEKSVNVWNFMKYFIYCVTKRWSTSSSLFHKHRLSLSLFSGQPYVHKNSGVEHKSLSCQHCNAVFVEHSQYGRTSGMSVDFTLKII